MKKSNTVGTESARVCWESLEGWVRERVQDYVHLIKRSVHLLDVRGDQLPIDLHRDLDLHHNLLVKHHPPTAHAALIRRKRNCNYSIVPQGNGCTRVLRVVGHGIKDPYDPFHGHAPFGQRPQNAMPRLLNSASALLLPYFV